MPDFKRYFVFIVLFMLLLFSQLISQHVPKSKKSSAKIQLIMRGDDIGFSKAANLACIKGYKQGIITSVEVIVPGPWFLDAARLLAENPELDVGVHLTLTCEWDNYKWNAITHAPSLITDDGYLPISNEQFAQMKISIEEVEQELRAQIKLALKYIPQVSHLSTHMGAPTSTQELINTIQKLSREFNIPFEATGVDQYMGMWAVDADQKENFLANTLNNLKPGLTIFVCHPCLNNSESQAIEGSGHDAMTRMAIHRQAVTDAVTSERIKQIIKQRNIQLISYADTYCSSK